MSVNFSLSPSCAPSAERRRLCIAIAFPAVLPCCPLLGLLPPPKEEEEEEPQKIILLGLVTSPFSHDPSLQLEEN